MKFSWKSLVLIGVIAVAILATAIFIPVPSKNTSNTVVQHEQIEEPQSAQLGDLFRTQESVPNNTSPSRLEVPTDIPEEESCVLDGQIVREGTVSSNTICVNE